MPASTNDHDSAGGIGARLRHLREARLLSQRDLATRSGVSQTTIVHIERGQTRPHPSTLRRLTAALAVDPDAILG